MNVYLISGLAADERIFRRLRFPEGYTPHYLKWIGPEKSETLPSYAWRMSRQIDSSSPFILIGLSFGGMLAIEINKYLSPVQTILISSIPTHRHLPIYYRLGGKLGLHRVLPVSFLQKAAMIKRWFTSEKNEDKNMLRHMIKNSDPNLIRWSMKAILEWENESIPKAFTHIHGSHDFILPVRYTCPTHTIAQAGHLMVLTKAGEINRILQSVLPQTPGP
ncbi:MAG TPA: alpha/beta hydrolase [Flavisolibacter sp.]|nr:alpha/beta hydrolase [Flavisolibacter sp.]